MCFTLSCEQALYSEIGEHGLQSGIKRKEKLAKKWEEWEVGGLLLLRFAGGPFRVFFFFLSRRGHYSKTTFTPKSFQVEN